MSRFILLDGRAHHDPDDAMIMATADSKEEAKEENFDYGDDCIWQDTKTGQLKYDWYGEWNR